MEAQLMCYFMKLSKKMNPSTQRMRKMTAPLVGFTRDTVPVEGVIELPIIAVRAPTEATMSLEFLVIRIPSAYNVILERSGLNAL